MKGDMLRNLQARWDRQDRRMFALKWLVLGGGMSVGPAERLVDTVLNMSMDLQVDIWAEKGAAAHNAFMVFLNAEIDAAQS